MKHATTEVIRPYKLKVSNDASSERRIAPDNPKLALKAMKMGLTALFKAACSVVHSTVKA